MKIHGEESSLMANNVDSKSSFPPTISSPLIQTIVEPTECEPASSSLQAREDEEEEEDPVTKTMRMRLEDTYGQLRQRRSRSSLNGEEHAFSENLAKAGLFYMTHDYGKHKTEKEASTVNFLSFLRNHVKRVSSTDFIVKTFSKKMNVVYRKSYVLYIYRCSCLK
jgi:hypothetical protein